MGTEEGRQYLLGRRFIIKTDHRIIKSLIDQRVREESQHPWLQKLNGYNYLVEHKKSKEKIVADTLLRREGGEVLGCSSITIVEPVWLKGVQQMVENSNFFQDLNKKFNEEKIFKDKYNMIKGVWFYKERVPLDFSLSLCVQVFEDHHNTPNGATRGIIKPYKGSEGPFGERHEEGYKGSHKGL